MEEAARGSEGAMCCEVGRVGAVEPMFCCRYPLEGAPVYTLYIPLPPGATVPEKGGLPPLCIVVGCIATPTLQNRSPSSLHTHTDDNHSLQKHKSARFHPS